MSCYFSIFVEIHKHPVISGTLRFLCDLEIHIDLVTAVVIILDLLRFYENKRGKIIDRPDCQFFEIKKEQGTGFGVAVRNF